MILSMEVIKRLKWQYSPSKNIIEILESHEELRDIIQQLVEIPNLAVNDNLRQLINEAVENSKGGTNGKD